MTRYRSSNTIYDNWCPYNNEIPPDNTTGCDNQARSTDAPEPYKGSGVGQSKGRDRQKATVSGGFSKNAPAACRIADGPSGGYLCKKKLVGRKTHGWVGSPPTQSCFHAFSSKKAYHCSWLAVFHAFPCKKVSHVGKNDRNVVSFTC